MFMDRPSRSPSPRAGCPYSTRGSILLEAILAVGLAALVFSAGVGLLLTSRSVGSRALVRQQALWAAQEGIDALQTMTFEDLNTTSSGGLAFASGHWQMDGSPDTLPEGLLRTVRVQDVQRDASCFIVPIGTVDPDTHEIESEISWTDSGGHPHAIILTGLRTRWENPQGSCFEPSMADCFDTDISEAEWYGGKQLREVFISNTCTDAVTVATMTITWNNSKKIQQVFFGSSKVWSASGPGTPSGDQVSGTLLNIRDETLSASQTLEVNKTQFTGTMAGTTVDIVFTFTDGSTVDTGPFVPSN